MCLKESHTSTYSPLFLTGGSTDQSRDCRNAEKLFSVCVRHITCEQRVGWFGQRVGGK